MLLISHFKKNIVSLADESYEKYLNFMDYGISREQARMLLPVSYYTEWYWKIDLHNLLHFLALRCDSHAQYEIRVFANAILSLIKPIVPLAVEAWEDYHVMRGAMKFTSLELEALKKFVVTTGLLKTLAPNFFARENVLSELPESRTITSLAKLALLMHSAIFSDSFFAMIMTESLGINLVTNG